MFFCIINSFNTVVSLFKDRILLLNLPLRASYLNEKITKINLWDRHMVDYFKMGDINL
ncbi:hypothetical protein BFO_0359 [Tannerella forsythia 92A2]|uniref:Uncharacterized protein n=1 Tax=Tannerella forsythia (strain ATCC 43037 / JCM 10827 / CCUG 21028 A / KCTC 5666 / FDC 338) TaxID=203275 RepID=G8UK53_TANFA|nr:hypothetical protein BFO_0359 [Tannerella forsythia 92A2]